jgi:hypothetical protein
MVIEMDDSRRGGAQTCRIMTRLIDVHAPQHDVSETLVLHVHAAPRDVLDAIDRTDPDPHAGIRALGRSDDERLFGLKWHPTPGAAGYVEVTWDLRVERGEDGDCYLSSTRRFTASDDAAREVLFASWRNVHAVANTVARRTLRRIKRTAEQPAAIAVLQPRAEMLLAA